MKTKKTLKLIILMLTLIISLFLILSCSPADDNSSGGNDGDGNQADVSDKDESGAADEAPTEPFPEPDVPVKDYGGVNFNVLYPFWGSFETTLFGDEETAAGSELDDAIWKRNKKIEDQINITFNPIVLGTQGNDSIKDILPAVRKSVSAGDGLYDLVLIHPMCDLNTFASGALVRNWNKMPHVDFSKPYWNQSMNDTLAINGILLFAANDFIIPGPTVMYYNKKIQQEYAIENLYDLVRNGTWTWDKFSQLAKQVTKDLNGDGVFDENDLYGLSLILDGSGMISMMHACDQYIAIKGEDDVPVLDIMSEKLVSLIDKIYDLVWNGNQTYTWENGPIYTDLKIMEMHRNFFPGGHALFTPGSPSSSATAEFRAMEVDFGILPYPKYDEAQTDYISLNSAGLMLVPMDVKDPEMVGIVCELLGAESRRFTLPAYYDVLLTHKGVRDEDSLEMLNIIFNNCVYDFGYNYNGFTNVSYIVPRVIAEKSTNVASFYEANAPSTIKNMEKVYKDIMKYEDLDY